MKVVVVAVIGETLVAHLQQHRVGIFQELTEILQPAGTDGTVHSAVVTAQGHRNEVAFLPAGKMGEGELF